MFGHKNNNIEALVEKHHWKKVEKALETADAAGRLAACLAFERTNDDEGRNLLVVLLSDPDPAVQLQAVKSLGVVGTTETVSHLRMLAGRTPESNVELTQALKASIAATKDRQ
mgnify:CR=1 FL=1